MHDHYQGTHDETKQAQDVRDRANQEVFIGQNGDPNLRYFRGDRVYAKWREEHLPSVMSIVERASTAMQTLDNKPKRQQFW